MSRLVPRAPVFFILSCLSRKELSHLFSHFSFGGTQSVISCSESSLPGAFAIFGVALGIRNVQAQLPNIVYALLSGLNTATVGLVAVAAVQLSERAITNKMERFIIAATGCAGMLYQTGSTFTLIAKSHSIVVLSRIDGYLWYHYDDIRFSNHTQMDKNNKISISEKPTSRERRARR